MVDIFSFTILISLLQFCWSANILAVFPFSAKSHFTMYKSLLDELHLRGHRLTVISHFPKEPPADNYTDINLAGATKSLHANMSLSDLVHFGLLENLRMLNEQIDDYEPLFHVKGVKDLIHTNSRFDLVLTEIYNTDLFLGFAHKFKCPNIAISPSPLMPWAFHRINLPIYPSQMPHVFTNIQFPTNIFNILKNTLEWATAIGYYEWVMNTKSQLIADKHFKGLPPLQYLAKQTSLILVNTHFSLHKHVPFSNRLVEVGGIHIKKAEKLEDDLEKFMDDADNGVIIFSMGSMFRVETMPQRIVDVFLNVFSSLKQRILWKWESGNPPQIKNIKFMKWLPQRDVLAHPKVKLFIYHGGLLGISEALYCGVPVLGFPQFLDMSHNMAALGDAGISLPLSTISENVLRKAIHRLIYDPRFKKNAVILSERFKDRPETPLSKAVYWVEYTIRYNGTNHIFQPQSTNYEIILLLLTPLLILLLMNFVIIKTVSHFKARRKPLQKFKIV